MTDVTQRITDLMGGYVAPAEERCCGIPMSWQEVFGIRRYECRHRSHHPAIYINLNTGQRISDENLPYLGGGYDYAPA